MQMLLAAFDSIAAAGRRSSDIIAAGMLPAALEMMDNLSDSRRRSRPSIPATPYARLCCWSNSTGLPPKWRHRCSKPRRYATQNGASEIRLAQSKPRAHLIWKGRKAAFAAVGRISPNYIVQDGVIPRTALPQVLRQSTRWQPKPELRVANVFHAGDGNLHPLVLYDRRDTRPGERAPKLSERNPRTLRRRRRLDHRRARRRRRQKARTCAKMFSEPDLETMQRVRCAFDPIASRIPARSFRRRASAAKNPANTSHTRSNPPESRSVFKNGSQRIARDTTRHLHI